jgi:hypothetical protein
MEMEYATIPLGAFVGYAHGGARGRGVDFVLSFDFPAFLVPGSDGDQVITNLWVLGVTARIHVGP